LFTVLFNFAEQFINVLRRDFFYFNKHDIFFLQS
jgi:hypothetical protein